MSRKSSKRKHTVHWFRKGLRLSDNPALLRGIRRCETFRCIFILDPWFAGSSNVGTNKWRWVGFVFYFSPLVARNQCCETEIISFWLRLNFFPLFRLRLQLQLQRRLKLHLCVGTYKIGFFLQHLNCTVNVIPVP